ncbi:DUF58 domain-containing protein [Actinotalea fermentans]|uniref:DUF58 domain-containing protein n=1 Tax=Actinotalea fermentans TaxID=43671 RepID=A0A511YZ85_9CELL|nr:DUF58 domain-containing protein [Actinotalea fermentans]GEN80494.1 hypothetical protein AFE02nite_22280 [Actinotalea fermentans]
MTQVLDRLAALRPPRLRLAVPPALLRAREQVTDVVGRGLRGVRGWRPGGLAVGGLGVLLLAVAGASWWAGGRYGWDELRVVAVGVAAVVVVAGVFLVGRSPYAVRLELAHRRVVVGERAVGRVEVANTSARGTLPAEIELPVGANLATFALPRLGPGATHEDLFAVPTSRRAVIAVGPVRSVRADPLGVARREVRWTDPIDLFVHPRTVSLAGTSAGFFKDLEGRPSRDLSPSDVSFHALREYVVGDDRRHVHWKSTARTGQLMVRQYEETRRSHLAVGLSTHVADYGSDEDEFELAVCVAGSLGLHAFREERDLTVLTQSGTLQTRTAGRLLDDLTRVQPSARRTDVVALAGSLATAAPGASIAMLVVGSGTSVTRLRAASARLPIEVAGVAVRCESGAEPSRRSVAELTVLTIGALEDLPVAMRRLGDA